MSIHEQSRWHSKEFVAINCGAIPESLMESLLFGYEGGAFSGARKDGQRGLLEKANGGTVFLDEAGEMPYSLQAKMLRTLQNFKIRRVGGSSVVQLDVRIIAASNKDLREEVERGAFREDLFYRLDIIPPARPPSAGAPRRRPPARGALPFALRQEGKKALPGHPGLDAALHGI